MTEVRVTEARADDVPFWWEMLLEATYPLPGWERSSLPELQEDPHNSIYLAGWGREGDRALIAEIDDQRFGAAWFRLFGDDQPPYGFIDNHTPQLAIAVHADHRGTGIGTMLLTALIAEARCAGFGALSLSVAVPNTALRLYERLDFECVSLDASSRTILLDLRAAPA